MAHGELVTWVSCHSDRPMWRYPTLCVLSKMYRKLLFDNMSIVWNIKVLLISFCRESPQMLCSKSQMGEIGWEEFEKVGLQHLRMCVKNGRRKWAWPMWRHSAQFNERVDRRIFGCAAKCMWVISQNALSLVIGKWMSEGFFHFILIFFYVCN